MDSHDCIPQRENEFPKEIYFNKYVRDKVCGASEAGKWRDLGIELLVNDDDIAVMNAKTHNIITDEKKCSSVVFELWRERQPQATWRQLINALYEVGLNRVAHDLENLLRPPWEQEQFSTNQDVSNSEIPQNQSDANDESISKKFRGRKLVQLNGRYGNVVDKIKKVIKQRRYKIKDLVLSLNNVDTDNSTIFSTNAASKITKINDLFFHIGTHCNIYNYDLLMAFLISIDCKEAIKILEGFTEELQNSVLEELDLLSEVGERNHTLVIKYIGDKCTLETEKLIRNIICECFHLQTWSVTFDCIQHGCIALVYHISSAVKSHILQYKTTATDVALLKKSHIKCVIIDNEVVKMSSGSTKIIPSGLINIHGLINLLLWISLMYDTLAIKMSRQKMIMAIVQFIKKYKCLILLFIFSMVSMGGLYIHIVQTNNHLVKKLLDEIENSLGDQHQTIGGTIQRLICETEEFQRKIDQINTELQSFIISNQKLSDKQMELFDQINTKFWSFSNILSSDNKIKLLERYQISHDFSVYIYIQKWIQVIEKLVSDISVIIHCIESQELCSKLGYDFEDSYANEIAVKVIYLIMKFKKENLEFLDILLLSTVEEMKAINMIDKINKKMEELNKEISSFKIYKKEEISTKRYQLKTVVQDEGILYRFGGWIMGMIFGLFNWS